jgi:tetratricopeptide (TPR) repeat protein
MVYRGRGERDKALECYRRSLAIERELGDTRGSGIAVGNMSVIYADRGDYDRALECYAQATNAHRTVDYPYGLTYWLSGTALTLFKIVRTADAMPEYLTKYVPDATESNWRRLSLDIARENSEECKRISTELQKPDTLRTSTVLLAQLDAQDGNAESARDGLLDLLAVARNESDTANCHYWLWKLELDPEVDHRGEAERIYSALMESDPDDDSKQRLEELRTKGDAS